MLNLGGREKEPLCSLVIIWHHKNFLSSLIGVETFILWKMKLRFRALSPGILGRIADLQDQVPQYLDTSYIMRKELNFLLFTMETLEFTSWHHRTTGRGKNYVMWVASKKYQGSIRTQPLSGILASHLHSDLIDTGIFIIVVLSTRKENDISKDHAHVSRREACVLPILNKLN